jgi:hypothetical protein
VRLAGWDPPAGDLGRPLHAVTVQTPSPRISDYG